jgi:hypothetical protein
LTDPMTTRGDLIYKDATNTRARLPRGAANTVLQSNGTDISYGTVTNAMLAGSIDLTTKVTGVLPTANGGNLVIVSNRTSTAGQSMPDATTTILDFATSVDATGTLAYTTGASYTAGTGAWVTAPKWTVTTAGYYEIKVNVCYAANATGYRELRLFKNGSIHRYLGQLAGHASVGILSGSTIINLAAADTIDIRTYQNSGGALALSTVAGLNFVTITYLGPA